VLKVHFRFKFADLILEGFEKGHKGSADSTMYPMDQPSTMDHQRLLEWLTVEYETADYKLEEMKTKKHIADNGGKPLTEYQKSQMKNLEHKKNEAKHQKLDAENFERHFGYTVYSSGHTLDLKHSNVMDWALIRLDEKNRFKKRPENMVRLNPAQVCVLFVS
jgi:hypothetical protein